MDTIGPFANFNYTTVQQENILAQILSLNEQGGAPWDQVVNAGFKKWNWRYTTPTLNGAGTGNSGMSVGLVQFKN